MSSQVMPLHYITVEFRLHGQDQEEQVIKESGQHRFLYGVEPWIEGVDQQLENLGEGEHLELNLDPDAAAFVASRLLPGGEWSKVESGLTLELKVVEIVKAEPKEVVKALAATVHCCDHCGNH
jgi:FKBP-type peptidyl-prolyl cis-trans isomerase 2